MISMIVAIGKNREIGNDGQMLWHVSEDFKNFKKITMNHHMIMGRKTFESIGRPLPGRTTIIVTRDKDYTQENCLIAHSTTQAIELAQKAGENEIFVCGGAQIYEQFLPLTEKLYLSKVDFEGPADTFFPEYGNYKWETLEEVEYEKIGETPAWNFMVLGKEVSH